ncbi:hypothetical protein DQ384_08280 [Sphaerisporangium album]|uniref:Tyr recombinase domain-containing protein n=1 Tax=Sphaerisporangium album TaxID=509200 RepID=A0A367FME0_9ACTN|nr:hypothetical protein DQ384_08280 [Sphaerisporangium album]
MAGDGAPRGRRVSLGAAGAAVGGRPAFPPLFGTGAHTARPDGGRACGPCGSAERRRLEDVTPHDLRATHATWVADRHGVMAAARRLGHSNASVTTRHYARAVEGRDREIADALDADHGTGNGSRDRMARTWHDEGEEDSPGVLTPV